MDADIKAEFVHSLRDNELTSSYLLDSEFISSTSYLKDERIIRKAQADLAINGYQEFRSHCGNSYVSETTNGGRFLASVKMVFANVEVKDKFTVGLEAIPLKNARLGLGVEKLSAKEKENSHMEIKLYQEGGRLSSLKNAVKSINPVSCKLSEWETCESLLKNIIDYSLNDFSKDVENGYTNVIGFKTSPYKIEHLKLDQTFRKQRDEYIRLIEETLKLADRVELILSSQSHKLTLNKKMAYNDILNDLKTRRDELFYNFTTCLKSKSNDINCVDPSSLDVPSLNKELIYEKILWANGPTVGGAAGKNHNLACNNFIQGSTEAKAMARSNRCSLRRRQQHKNGCL